MIEGFKDAPALGAKWYIQKFGNKSWELDALSPEVLAGLVEHNIKSVISAKVHNEVMDREAADRKNLHFLANKIQQNGIESLIND